MENLWKTGKSLENLWEFMGSLWEISGNLWEIYGNLGDVIGGNGGYYAIGDVKKYKIYIHTHPLILLTCIHIYSIFIHFQNLHEKRVICGFTRKW